MKSGIGWHLKGVRREARETAHEAARRSGMSVGEWLDTVIIDSALDEGVAPARAAEPRHSEQRPQPKRRQNGEQPARQRPTPDNGLAEVNDRLDDLTRQLDKLARLNASHAQRAPVRDEENARQFEAVIGKVHQRLDQLAAASARSSHAAAVGRTAVDPQPAAPGPAQAAPATPLDHAMMEIADRQRALDGYPATPRPVIAAPAAAGPLPRARSQEFHGLEQQLRDINARIETLGRPCAVDTAVQKAVDTLRDDLAEIGVMLQEAMPRKAVEALEGEMRNLAERIDHTRQSGTDASALGGVERALAEVRDALRGLMPAESLAGLGDTVQGLAQKIDSLALGQQDPAALRQLEGAIVAMRGIVSHVASNDALATLAEDVRVLAAKVDQATGDSDVLSSLERRIATLADALEERNHGNNQAVPHELEAALKELGDKIERLQLDRSDQTALGHLEDRIVKLVDKLDASDARLNQLEAIERGLAELLIHIEHNRVPQLAGTDDPRQPPARVDALQRDLANLQQTERKTQDSLEVVQGALSDVVDRLAMIENDIRGGVEQTVMETAKAVIASAAPARADHKVAAEPSPLAAETPAATTVALTPALPAAANLPPSAAPDPVEFPSEASQARLVPLVAGERRPIDPNLPPDHPLEPGAARGRYAASPADRIAASEAALASAKPPVIADPGVKSYFIAAARRAAQAAATAQASPRGGAQAAVAAPAKSAGGGLITMVRKHARTVIVGISVIVIVLGSLNIVRTWFGGTEVPEDPAPSKTSSSAPTPDSEPDAPATAVEAPSSPAEQTPGRQSLFPTSPVAPFVTGGLAPDITRTTPQPAPGQDITGTVPPPAQSTPVPAVSVPPVPPANGIDKLPPSIGGALRTAAAKGDAAAQFEIAMRYVEGRGVTQNLTEAAEWFERAAKQGLIPAQFRLGGLYEKGLGVKKNAETARRYYTAAGEAGHAKALHNLAVLYAEGIDGKPDYPTAALWFRKAAVYGVSDSQYNLAILYARGIGVEQNLAEAYRWFALAARSGDQESAKKRDDVAARLDAQSLQMAKQAVDAFTVEPQPEAATQVKSPAGGWDASANTVPVVAPAGKRRQSAVGPRLDLTSPQPAR
jgi:localization factor PodJL